MLLLLAGLLLQVTWIRGSRADVDMANSADLSTPTTEQHEPHSIGTHTEGKDM